MVSLRESASSFFPALVVLSGARRGNTEFLADDTVQINVSSKGAAQLIGVSAGEPVFDLPAGFRHLATLERRGSTYELRSTPGSLVWVNGEQVESMVMASGDVIELGRPGTVLRFRLYPADRAPYKTLAEAFSDCLDCARYGGEGSLAKAGIFLSNIPRELTTQTRPAVRLGMFVVVALLIVAMGALWTHNVRLERRLAEESARVEGLAELLERKGTAYFTRENFEAARSELEETLRDTTARVESLEARAVARERIISESSPAVVFLQGAYGFIEPTTRSPLRYLPGPDGRPLRAPDGRTPVTVQGDGPVVEILYTGSAFVVDEEGHLLTNRHVALPWEYEASAQAAIEQGFEPVMRRLIGYLPSVEEPFDVVLVSASDTADVALLRCEAPAKTLPPLALGVAPPRPGDEVIVLGYPTGMRALVARAGRGLSEKLFADGAMDFWELARALSAGHLIGPLATQGIVGQVTSETIVYDAETTHGGSGGPVLGLDGNVVAVNAAILAEFGGSNLGVPASEARRLIEASREK